MHTGGSLKSTKRCQKNCFSLLVTETCESWLATRKRITVTWQKPHKPTLYLRSPLPFFDPMPCCQRICKKHRTQHTKALPKSGGGLLQWVDTRYSPGYLTNFLEHKTHLMLAPQRFHLVSSLLEGFIIFAVAYIYIYYIYIYIYVCVCKCMNNINVYIHTHIFCSVYTCNIAN